MSHLTLERNAQEFTDAQLGVLTPSILITPAVGEDYWTYRVSFGGQAIVGFPKFGTIGIGFAVEEDWNTNLPYTCDTEMIFNHIAHNKGDEAIPDDDVREAIRLVQQAATADRSAA